jgi:AraC-like DNA-binding protein
VRKTANSLGRIKSGSASASEYHTYLPAVTTMHIDKSRWGALGLDAFRLYEVNEGVTAPSVPDFTVGYVTSGLVRNALYSFDGSRPIPTTLRTGSCVLVNKETTITWGWHEDFGNNPPMESVVIHLDPQLFKDAAVKCFDKTLDFYEIINQVIHDDELIAQLALALKNEALEETPAMGVLYRDTCAQLLTVHLLKKYFNFTLKSAPRQQVVQQRRLSKVTDYIHDHLDSSIPLKTLAQVAGISEYHLIYEFKRATGLAPHQYIIKLRIERAKWLLKCTDWSILRIALEIGYGNHSHFTDIFRRSVGSTPSRYREQTKYQ